MSDEEKVETPADETAADVAAPAEEKKEEAAA